MLCGHVNGVCPAGWINEQSITNITNLLVYNRVKRKYLDAAVVDPGAKVHTHFGDVNVPFKVKFVFLFCC